MSGHFELLDHDSENVRMYRGVGTIFIPPKPIRILLFQVQEQNIREREYRR